MTMTTQDSQSTTYDWLQNILKNSLTWIAGRILLWRDKRPYAIERWNEEKPKGYKRAYDKSEYDSWGEGIRINDKLEISGELVQQLLVAVESNPYPGKQMRVLQVAVEQVPDAGKSTWCLILADTDFGFPPNFANEKICFPAAVEIAIEELERLLYEQVREDNTLLAGEVPAVLSLPSRGVRYLAVKKELQRRGWVWSQRREEGKKVKIVTAPPEPSYRQEI